MATTYHTANYMPDRRFMRRIHQDGKAQAWVIPLGRFFFSLIFILSGINHFTSGSISYAASQGLPLADILVPVSGLFAILGGLSVMTGLHTKFGALLLLLFLLPVTVVMHDFWNASDAQVAQQEMIHFMKNLAMIGAALFLFFYGGGPLSWDRKQRKNL